MPIIFIVGPPRSGTTLVAQTLIRHLPVAYINNLTVLFPRSPISINKIIGRPFRNDSQGTDSYFGKTVGFWGQNDALHIWDRWLGTDRTTIPAELNPCARRGIREFFGAYEQLSGLPLVAKNNNLNASAHLIAEVLPNATFLCLRRDPHALAQSLLLSRKQIHGSPKHRYGLDDPDFRGRPVDDAIADVCRQIKFFHGLEKIQRARIGADRFWTIPYESFCQDPSGFVAKIATEILGVDSPFKQQSTIRPFKISSASKLNPTDLLHLEEKMRGFELEKYPVKQQGNMEPQIHQGSS